MAVRIKIAIYSGVIPSTTFIEHLIQVAAKEFEVYVFGTAQEKTEYNNAHIRVFKTPESTWLNFWLTLGRSFKLFFKSPRLIAIAIKEANKNQGGYVRWMRFSRYVPVLLYQPDIFHLQWANEINRWTFLKEAYNCKIVVSALGTLVNISPKLHLKLKQRYLEHFKYVDAFHTVSDALINDLKCYTDSQKIYNIGSILPNHIFEQFSLPKKRLEEPLKVVSIGRHHWVKGYKYALQAMAKIKRNIKVNYTIIAPGKPTEEIVFLRYALDLEDEVNFVSSMPHSELIKELKQYDLMLLPSLSEGIANVALEAMAVGLPVISTDCGGMSERIEHKKTGWLMEVRDPNAIAKQILETVTLSHPEIEKITQEAHNLVKAKHNETKIAKELKVFYKDIYKS